MVKIGIIDIPIFQVSSTPVSQTCFLSLLLMQQTLASFAPRQNGMQAPSSVAAVPPHLQAQSSRTGTPQFPTPPPGAYGGAPRTGPPGYPSSYASGSGGTSVSMGHYNAPPAPQATNQSIPAALATIPESQRVSNNLGVWDNNTEQCEQDVVLKLINMRPEEIAMLPPTERTSVMQLVRLNLLYGSYCSHPCVNQRASLGIH